MKTENGKIEFEIPYRVNSGDLLTIFEAKPVSGCMWTTREITQPFKAKYAIGSVDTIESIPEVMSNISSALKLNTDSEKMMISSIGWEITFK